MKKISILSVLLFAACSQSQVESGLTSPSGENFASIKCSSNASACFRKASALCKGTYRVVSSESHAGGVIADIIPGPVTWYHMDVICGKPDGIMPSFPFRGPVYYPPKTINCTHTQYNSSCTEY